MIVERLHAVRQDCCSLKVRADRPFRAIEDGLIPISPDRDTSRSGPSKKETMTENLFSHPVETTEQATAADTTTNDNTSSEPVEMPVFSHK